MFTFCDVLHEIKQKTQQTPESAQYGLKIIYNSHIIIESLTLRHYQYLFVYLLLTSQYRLTALD